MMLTRCVNAAFIEESITRLEKLYTTNVLNDEHFRTRTAMVPSDSQGDFLGRITCAAAFG